MRLSSILIAVLRRRQVLRLIETIQHAAENSPVHNQAVYGLLRMVVGNDPSDRRLREALDAGLRSGAYEYCVMRGYRPLVYGFVHDYVSRMDQLEDDLARRRQIADEALEDACGNLEEMFHRDYPTHPWSATRKLLRGYWQLLVHIITKGLKKGEMPYRQ